MLLLENVAKCKVTTFALEVGSGKPKDSVDDSADFYPSLLIFRRIVIFLYT